MTDRHLTTHQFLPRHHDEAYYRERTDRNIGWITEAEQQYLKTCAVGIAGCGGMGGLLGQIFVRLGVGEVRIADNEVFDVSNINRQFGAAQNTIGKSKALVTAEKIRETSDDTALIVYPQGITEETVSDFVDGCDVVCDEIEFWAVGARMLLHRHARERDITLFNCNTVGHRTFLFRFTKESMPVEVPLGMSLATAMVLQNKIQNNTATDGEIRRVMRAVLKTFVPHIPEYLPNETHGTAQALVTRLFEEQKAPIIATNPPMASGFCANHVLLHLLESCRLQKRNTIAVPEMPGYLAFDAALMQTWIECKPWWQ